jgi:hypothetical protein
VAEATAEEILADLGKLRTADHARLMADNQRTLDAVNRHDRSARDLSRRIDEAMARRSFGELLDPPPGPPPEEPVNIYVDSPVTINAAPAASAGTGQVPAGSPGPATAPGQPVAGIVTAVPQAVLQAVPQAVPQAVSVATRLAPWILAAGAAIGTGGVASAVTSWAIGSAGTAGVVGPAADSASAALPTYDVERWVPSP